VCVQVDVEVSLASVGLAGGKASKSRDIWAKKDLGPMSGTWSIKALGGHDSMFVRFTV
jgi:hypothetical protein